jgi:hypothetical protein
MYCIVARLCFLCPSSCFSASKLSLCPCDTASIPLASKIEMAPKRKASSSSDAVIPPIDPNSQLPFAGNHMSLVFESDLLHLVSIGVLPLKELCSWRICRGVTVPTEDTHKSVVYVPSRVDVLDAGLGSSRAASRASSTLEHGLEGQEADLDCPAPMEVTEGPSALEVAAAENSALKDGVGAHPASEGVAGGDSARMGNANCDPAPEGVAGDDPARMGSANYDPTPEVVRAGSPSCTSMDVHVGSPPHSGCMVVAQAFGQGVALEACVPDNKVLGSSDDTELVPADSLQVAPGGDPSPSHQLISHDLGVPSFFSNLQVLWFILV